MHPKVGLPVLTIGFAHQRYKCDVQMVRQELLTSTTSHSPKKVRIDLDDLLHRSRR